MKKFLSLSAVVALATAILVSCASTGTSSTSEIPAAPEAVPAAAPAPAAAAGGQAASAPAAGTAQPSAEAETAPAAPTLAERIEAADENITIDEALDIATQLTDPANDPDGSLTRAALAKADEIVKKLIDTAMSVDTVNYYIDLGQQGAAYYKDYVDMLHIDLQYYFDRAEERIAMLNAYEKNSYYTYLKQYRKGLYRKELAQLLTEKNKKN